jgi:hypothetical protein
MVPKYEKFAIAIFIVALIIGKEFSSCRGTTKLSLHHWIEKNLSINFLTSRGEKLDMIEIN